MKTIIEFCIEVLDAYFAKHKPEVAKLDPFVPRTGILAPLLRDDTKIPIDPLDGSPSLLFHGLNPCDDCVDTEVYQHLENSSGGLLPAALYATSGGGKTRALLEYLSRNKGLYFVAGRAMLRRSDNRQNPGSRDISTVFQGMEVVTAGTKDGVIASNKNLTSTRIRVGVMIVLRYLVHEKIEAYLKRKITAYEWLLYQLYPEKFLGRDIYEHALDKFLDAEPTIDTNTNTLRSALAEAIKEKDEDETLFKLCCIDEAQSLLEESPAQLFLSSDGEQKRANFYGLLWAVSEVSLILKRGCPVFSGTGLSIDDLEIQCKSLMAKRMDGKEKPLIFSDFKPLNVTEYLKKFLVVDKISDEVLSHLAKWLNGRPRWSATFLEVYLCRSKRAKREGEIRTRGSFNESEARIMEALDRFLMVITSAEPDTDDCRLPWPPGDRSAYSAIFRVMKKPYSQKLDDARIKFRFAVFEFAVGKNPSLVPDETRRLIQEGVCQIKTTRVAGNTRYEAVLNEPILVQAGINFYGLENSLEFKLTVQEKGGRGHAFEKVMLPALQDKDRFATMVQNQLKEENIFSGFSVSQMLSYGVLAEPCSTVHDTLRWLEAATSAWFEGTVPPFCYPDEDIGPDLIFLLRNELFTEFRTCISQAKFRKSVDQLEALQSITPHLLYHANRGAKKSKPPFLSQSLAKDCGAKGKWTEVKKKLMSDERPCLRLIVQCPVQGTDAAKPGRCDHDMACPKHQKTAKRRKTGRDALVAIQGSNGDALFGEETAAVLAHIKKMDV